MQEKGRCEIILPSRLRKGRVTQGLGVLSSGLWIFLETQMFLFCSSVCSLYHRQTPLFTELNVLLLAHGSATCSPLARGILTCSLCLSSQTWASTLPESHSHHPFAMVTTYDFQFRWCPKGVHGTYLFSIKHAPSSDVIASLHSYFSHFIAPLKVGPVLYSICFPGPNIISMLREYLDEIYFFSFSVIFRL